MTVAAGDLESRSTVFATFDSIAESYDATFTDSLIGRAQRNAVWRELAQVFHPGERVIELNCGTGVDAVFLASRGVSVDAFDVSARMIQVARRRLAQERVVSNVNFRVLATEEMGQLDDTYDGAFSNFGGLNCVPDLRSVAQNLSKLVRLGGNVLLCLANRLCLWELFWYGRTWNWEKATRRWSKGGTQARLSGSAAFQVRYPSINDLRQLFSPDFNLQQVMGIGVVVPPSYIEPLAVRFPRILNALAKADLPLGRCPGFRSTADHILLRFERVET